MTNHSIASKIRRGISRLPWSVRWGAVCEAAGKPCRDAYADAPKAPDWAVNWADALVARVEQENGKTTTELYGDLKRAGYGGDSEQFGIDLAMLSFDWLDSGRLPYFENIVRVPRSKCAADLSAFPPVRIVG